GDARISDLGSRSSAAHQTRRVAAVRTFQAAACSKSSARRSGISTMVIISTRHLITAPRLIGLCGRKSAIEGVIVISFCTDIGLPRDPLAGALERDGRWERANRLPHAQAAPCRPERQRA